MNKVCFAYQFNYTTKTSIFYFHLKINPVRNFMTLVIQGLTLLLVLLSLGLIVLVPVTLANPSDWEESKGTFAQLARVWTGLVFLTGFVSTFGV